MSLFNVPMHVQICSTSNMVHLNSAVWRDTLSVLVARGRAQVSVAAAVADWPKRIRDMRYVDHEDCDGLTKSVPHACSLRSSVYCVDHA